MRALAWLERQPRAAILIAILLLIGLVGWTDYLTGTEIAFSVFYFIPVSAAAYLLGVRTGLWMAVVCGIVWLLADLLGGHTYSSPFLGLWNMLNRLASFVVLATLLGGLRRAFNDQREMARTDGLTGTRNRRHFEELVTAELDRARRFRRWFTVVHIDLDEFKSVNDRMGHGEGDAVLRAVAEAARRGLRATDVLARLGGDEFAVLLPESEPEAARAAVSKLQVSLDQEMRRHRWPVTFSIGVLTCADPPADADHLMQLVDALTYAAKSRGKNRAVFEVVTSPAASPSAPAAPAAARPAGPRSGAT